MGARTRAQLIELARARAARPDTPRLVDSGPVCQWRGCGKPLIQKRPHQRFCTPKCRYQAWLAGGGRGPR
jgi:hypothetical protein